MNGRQARRFGRLVPDQDKPRTEQGRPLPDDDGITRVFPRSLWDGPGGETMREAGFGPDDPANIVPTKDHLQAKHDALYEQEKEFLKKVNAQLPCEVAPWAMIPWSVWQGQHADFLMTVLDLYPVGPWNLMLLPADDRGAMLLGLPRHPMSVDPEQVVAAERIIGEIRADVEKAQAQARQSDGTGRTDGLAELGAVVDRAKDELCALAFLIGKKAFGDAVWDRHMQVFGSMLGWPSQPGQG